MTVELSKREIERYSRHLILPEFGMAGQRRLKESSVLMVGAGGLGSPLGMYLAAAGVGRLGIVDFDIVDESNLQRQIMHGVDDVGKSKLESAKRRIQQINPHVQVDSHELRLSSENALDIIKRYDLVADGTDNFPTRYLVNDACVLAGKPNVYASIFRFEGQVSVFNHGDGPNYRDLYPEPPPPGMVPSCAEGGVLGVLPGIVGTLQATETIKVLTGIGKPLVGRLLLIDALEMSFRVLKLRRDPNAKPINELVDYEQFCGIPQARMQENQQQTSVPEITVQQLKEYRESGRPFFLLDVRKAFEKDIADIGADQLIPHEEIEARVAELKATKDQEIVVHCRSGGRSAKAVQALHRLGYTKAVNLRGGTLAWSAEIDSSVAKY